jgi:hypothetical protein
MVFCAAQAVEILVEKLREGRGACENIVSSEPLW